MKILLLLLGVVVLAGLVAWSLAVLPNQSKQDRLGASIEQGISGLLQEEQEPSAGTESAEITSTSVDISGQAEPPKENAIPVLLDPPQVKAGNKIKVTVGVSSPFSVRLVDIFLEGPGGQVSRGNIVNIDGEGQWFGHIPILEDAEPGVWKVKTVEITDIEGNIISYSFGTDIFSTFKVE